MRHVRLVKLIVLALFIVGGAAMLLSGSLDDRRAYARSSGPDPGFTGAPGEFDCRECHLPDGAPSGTVSVSAPQTYVSGQTYQITLNQTNTSPTRQRWGFQLTAIDDSGNRAGTLLPGPDGRTQVIAGTTGSHARQYVEHTSAGTFQGQQASASWTFNWTAPNEDVGPVLFYYAGNQANGDGNTSGDSINFNFVSIQPAGATGDFTVTVTPTTQTILPGAGGSYNVTVTPAKGFTGTVELTLAVGVPVGADFTFSPASVQITDATPRTSTLTFATNSHLPLGNFTQTVIARSGGRERTATFSLVTGPTMLDQNLTVRAVAGGLVQPTTLAFIGPNDLFVLEKASGRVRRVTNGVPQSSPALDLAVNSASERGLLGVALHPNFPIDPRVYLYWTESSTGVDTTDINTVGLLGNRVSSFVWDGATLSQRTDIMQLRALQQDDANRGNHNGGVIRFGPDGKLYVIVGDLGRRGLLQNLRFGPSVSPDGPVMQDDQFGGPEPDDEHLSGIVLRLNDDGSTPADNPFFNVDSGLAGEAATNVKKVYAYGVRNGFGMAFDPVSGYLWTQENGDDSFDELNRVVPGFNGGWIQLMGPMSRVAEFKQIEVSRGNNLQQSRWPPDRIADTPEQARARLYPLPGARYTDPEFSWRYAVAPSPLGFVRGRALGPQFEGDLFVGASRLTLAGGYLFRLKLGGDRRGFSFTDARLNDKVADNHDKFDGTESESLLVGRDFGITTDIQTGPDGSLYVVSLSNGTIYQVSAKPNTIQFGQAAYTAAENGAGASATVTVTRAGDTSGTVSVNYRTVDDPAAVRCDTRGSAAYARCDYATVVDTLTFGPGETSKTFAVPLINDAHPEDAENVTLMLFNPAGATLGPQRTATLQITDADAAGGTNPVLASPFFVRQQYLDFLSREPEDAGFQSWLDTLNGCHDPFNRDPANPSAACDRVIVSSSFFRSDEFQLKGLYVYLFYKATLGRLPLYAEITPDMRAVTGQTSEEVVFKRDAFAREWVNRPSFLALYPATLSDVVFVDRVLANAGVTLATPDPVSGVTRNSLVSDLQSDNRTRAEVVRLIVESREVNAREFNGAFVAMQYFGYLRRDPEADGY
ncbi:MAG: PQQ-dependent sugar dehydrogenase, partial [Pyrinomonadaceae bacterium]